MNKAIHQVDVDKVLELFKEILSKQAPTALEFIDKKQDAIINKKSDSTYYITFGTLPKYVPTKEVSYSKSMLDSAADIRKNWDLSLWYLDQIARIYLLLTFAKYRLDDFHSTLNNIVNAADAHELITLYQAFSLFPYPEKLLLLATNGIRCNMISAFNAIALNNPYPCDFFDEKAWNQLVLKTIFVDSPIEKVVGLKQRANLELAHVLLNTIQERFAAKRPIKLEIWYLVGIAADEGVLQVLNGFLEHASPILQNGALISCQLSALPEAKALVERYADKYQQSTVQDNLLSIQHLENSLISAGTIRR